MHTHGEAKPVGSASCGIDSQAIGDRCANLATKRSTTSEAIIPSESGGVNTASLRIVHTNETFAIHALQTMLDFLGALDGPARWSTASFDILRQMIKIHYQG